MNISINTITIYNKNVNTRKGCRGSEKRNEGAGTDENAIIKLVANRTNAQRQKIKLFYKSSYGRDLVEDLKKELSGNFEDAVIALFYDPVEYDCYQLRKAMKGLGTDEDTLIEIIATRPNWMIKAINKKYQEMYKKNLQKDVESETSGTFKRLLVSLLQGNRSENTHPNQEERTKNAKELYEAGEKNW